MTIKVGVTLPQFTDDIDTFKRNVELVEASGLDSMWVFDHLWPLSGGKERPILECWSTLAWAAAATERIEVGTMVTRSSLRHPAVLAKMGATVASIAPERLTITVGSGDRVSRGENEAFGIPYYAADRRIEQLASTVKVLRSFFHDPSVTQHDDFVDVDSLPPSPRPAVPPKVWVGGRAGDTLELAATYADGWNGWGDDVERFAQDAGSVLGFAQGREVELSWGGLVVLGATDDAAAEVAAKRNSKEGAIVGGPETVARRLERYAETGATHLIVTFAGAWTPESLGLLADEVAPRVRT